MTNNMSSRSEESKWNECQPGMLSNYASATVKPATTLGTTKIAGLSLAVACGIVVLFFSSRLFTPGASNNELPYKGGLTCVEVMDSMPRYFDDSMTTELLQRTNQHLVDCGPCRVAFEKEASSRGVEFQIASGYSPVLPTRPRMYSSLAVVSFRP